MFPVGVLILFLGYGLIYYGVKNLGAASQVITLREALGIPGTTTPTAGATPREQQTIQDWTGGSAQ